MYRTCVVIPSPNKGWIIDRIAHEVGKRIEGEVFYSYSQAALPPSESYLIMHYALTPAVFELNPGVEEKSVVFFTHESLPISRVKPFLKKVRQVIAENKTSVDLLVKKGVPQNKVSFVPEGSDPEMFKPHKRNSGPILISGCYYERKSPQLMLSIIQNMPQRRFFILGTKWEQWNKFKKLASLPNVELVQNVDYCDYPRRYEKCDVYLSTSALEGGGPNALIESMMANLVPVVSDTGNARDYIYHGRNGFIFPIGSKPRNVEKMIEDAYKLDTDVSKSVQGFTWDVMAQHFKKYL